MRNFLKQIHIWLSIPFGIVISVICFSGAMLIFEPEITAKVQSNYQRVEHVGVVPLPLDELLRSVEPTLKEGQRITGVTIFDDKELCYKVSLSEPKHAATYIDQYSGEVKGQPERLSFFRTMFRLHRWLMDDRPEDNNAIFWGKMIVGVSTLMFIFIVISGIFIWIPKSIKALKNRTQIALRKGWHRFFYDLHVAGGIYATLLLLAMALTGLTWSFEWYRNDFYRLFGVEVEAKSNAPQKGEKEGRRAREDNAYISWERAYRNTLDIVGSAEKMTIAKGSVSVPCEGWGNQRAADKYSFDEASGEVIAKELYGDSERSRKVRGWIYSVHVGNWGGMLTRILWFLAAMLGATLPLTGYYLWIKRKFIRKRARL